MGTGHEDVDDFELRTGITRDDIRRLGKHPLFSGLLPDALRQLLSNSSVRRYPDHTTLFMQGDPADRFFITMEGWVKLFRLSENGQEVVISVASPGDSFAEAAIFDSNIFPVNASAITDVRLLVVNSESLLRQLAENTQLTFNMMASMSRQMRSNVTTLHQMCSMSSTERLADFLLTLTDIPAGPATITLPLDKSLIAARLGMQPETFSRSLSKLKASGVTSEGHNVIIKDIDVLRAMINKTAMSC
ncbi:MAG: Crp/Fnr family transcriptional regulator [Magnetovibrio sp.]|nr:Crp/Fnr family transcriptional regulator [Magnetovibrio sp.]